jgi:hypothetical protein
MSSSASSAPISGLAVKCPNCGAALNLSPDTIVYVCRYCGWSGFVDNQQLNVVGVSPQSVELIKDKVGKFISKQAGRDSNITEQKLIMAPFWLVLTHAHTRYNGYKRETRSRTVGTGKNARTETYEVYKPVRGVIEEDQLVSLFARRHERMFALDRAEWAVKNVKPEPFPPDLLKSLGKQAEFLSSSIDLDEANHWAQTYVSDDHRRRVEGMCTKVFDCYTDATVKSSQLTFYPLYYARFQTRGRTFRLMFDAATGKVLEAELPLTAARRATLLLTGYASSAILALVSFALQRAQAVEDSGTTALILGVAAAAIAAYTTVLATRAQRRVEG